jgi:aldehyde:ferredoxin oxidoreductase
MFGGNRYGVHFVSLLTGGYGECTSGGHVAPQFARSGFRVMIVEGAAERPVYLEVSEDGAVIHPADDVWGLDTYQAEEALVARHLERFPKAQACVIGPAGEKLVDEQRRCILRSQSALSPQTHSAIRNGGCNEATEAKVERGW